MKMNKWVKRIGCLILFVMCLSVVKAEKSATCRIPFDKGTLLLTPLQDKAVRSVDVGEHTKILPEWI